MSARKRSSCSTLSTSPWRRYSAAWATAPGGASDSPASSASGSSSPPSARSGMRSASHRARSRSKPSLQPRRPPRMRQRTTRAPERTSPTRAAGSSAEAGLAQRTSGKPAGRRSTAAAAARISVSAVVTRRITRTLGVLHGRLLGMTRPVLDRCGRASFLTPGSAPSPPSRPVGQWRRGGALPGHSGATVPDSHRLPHLAEPDPTGTRRAGPTPVSRSSSGGGTCP